MDVDGVTTMRILAVNAGSTSLKASLYETTASDTIVEPRTPLWTAHVVWAEPPAESVISIRACGSGELSGETVAHTCLETPGAAIRELLVSLWEGPTAVLPDASSIDAVVHRVVFGGAQLHGPTRLTPAIRERIANVTTDAPTHNAVELAIIDTVSEVLGDEQCQVVVFDTDFHATLPRVAYAYGGPYAWVTAGLRRYGFHGISHRYAAARAAHVLGRDLEALRIVTVHLGGGASVTAVHHGISVDTTMGFTPMDGLVMATRAGSVDPGLLLHLLRRGEYTVETLDRALNHESGIKGLSGLSGDMQTVVAAAHAGDDRARLAVDVYAYRARQHIAAMAAAMNGLDALVFTAGVGEHSPDIREAICTPLGFLGIEISDAANHAAVVEDRAASLPTSSVPILVIHAEENWTMAQMCGRL